MKEIILSNGLKTIVDDEDYGLLSKLKWSIGARGYVINSKYVRGSGSKNQKNEITYMHRLLMNPPKGKQVDHINRNRLDNRKGNLRIVTPQQQNFNHSIQRNNTSGFIGITWINRVGKWRAYIKKDKKQIHLGYFFNRKDASTAYQLAKARLHTYEQY